MPKLHFKKGVPIEGVAIEIQGEPHLLRFGNLALSSLEEQLDLDAPEALSRVARLLSTGRINTRLTLALVAAGMAHEAVAGPRSADVEGSRALVRGCRGPAGHDRADPQDFRGDSSCLSETQAARGCAPNPPAEPAGE